MWLDQFSQNQFQQIYIGLTKPVLNPSQHIEMKY